MTRLIGQGTHHKAVETIGVLACVTALCVALSVAKLRAAMQSVKQPDRCWILFYDEAACTRHAAITLLPCMGVALLPPHVDSLSTTTPCRCSAVRTFAPLRGAPLLATAHGCLRSGPSEREGKVMSGILHACEVRVCGCGLHAAMSVQVLCSLKILLPTLQTYVALPV